MILHQSLYFIVEITEVERRRGLGVSRQNQLMRLCPPLRFHYVRDLQLEIKRPLENKSINHLANKLQWKFLSNSGDCEQRGKHFCG